MESEEKKWTEKGENQTKAFSHVLGDSLAILAHWFTHTTQHRRQRTTTTKNIVYLLNDFIFDKLNFIWIALMPVDIFQWPCAGCMCARALSHSLTNVDISPLECLSALKYLKNSLKSSWNKIKMKVNTSKCMKGTNDQRCQREWQKFRFLSFAFVEYARIHSNTDAHTPKR